MPKHRILYGKISEKIFKLIIALSLTFLTLACTIIRGILLIIYWWRILVMSNNTDFLKNYISSKKMLMKQFSCDDDFFIKPLENLKWAVKSEDDFSFLMYWTDDDKRHSAVIVKKNGSPMVYKTDMYTMVIAIDCIKTAFVFSNNNYSTEE